MGRFARSARLAGCVEALTSYTERGSEAVSRRQAATAGAVLFVTWGDPMEVRMGEVARSFSTFVAGVCDRPLRTGHRGSQDGIGVHLGALGVARLLGLPGSELANRCLSLDEVLGGAAAALVERMASIPEPSRRVSASNSRMRPTPSSACTPGHHRRIPAHGRLGHGPEIAPPTWSEALGWPVADPPPGGGPSQAQLSPRIRLIEDDDGAHQGRPAPKRSRAVDPLRRRRRHRHTRNGDGWQAGQVAGPCGFRCSGVVRLPADRRRRESQRRCGSLQTPRVSDLDTSATRFGQWSAARASRGTRTQCPARYRRRSRSSGSTALRRRSRSSERWVTTRGHSSGPACRCPTRSRRLIRQPSERPPSERPLNDRPAGDQNQWRPTIALRRGSSARPDLVRSPRAIFSRRVMFFGIRPRGEGGPRYDAVAGACDVQAPRVSAAARPTRGGLPMRGELPLRSLRVLAGVCLAEVLAESPA